MKIMAIGIHPDDVELGCGGAVILAADHAHEVTVVDMSDGSASSNGTVDERRAEAQAAAGIMGVAARLNLGFPDTAIRSEDAEQLARVVSCIRAAAPDLVLLPSSDDAHPDHMAGGELARRAVYLSGIHGYAPDEAAHRVRSVLVYPGRSEMNPDVIIDVTTTFDRKIEAVKAHASQFGTESKRRPTPLNTPDFMPFIEARCRVYGRQIGVRYGEPFLAAGPLALAAFDIFSK